MIGYYDFLGIFDIQKNQETYRIEPLQNVIYSLAFSRDNQSVFISNCFGYIKMIKWKAGANNKDEFDFNEEPKQMGNFGTEIICLTKDEKYLLVGSHSSLCVFETTTRKVIKEFKLSMTVIGINLIKNGTKAIIAQGNGGLSILDLETLEMTIIKNMTDNLGLEYISVI